MINRIDLKEALTKGKKRLNNLHPELNDFQINQLLTKEYFKRVNEPLFNYKEAIHYSLPNRGYNVACFNGSVHIKRTDNRSHVNCANCLLNM